jgi:hypothetical protein
MSDGTLESRGALASRLVARCQELEAHVAALVQAAERFIAEQTIEAERALNAVLDAPDLAALVARAEKEQAFIEASRCYWDAPNSITCGEVMRTLAALDTKEP